jgi:hypothetical protein
LCHSCECRCEYGSIRNHICHIPCLAVHLEWSTSPDLHSINLWISILLKDKRVAKSKHNYWCSGGFMKQTTCFGPCTGPSSVLNLHVGGDYTVSFSTRSGSLQTQRDLVILWYSHVCQAITSAKSFYNFTIGTVVWVQIIWG